MKTYRLLFSGILLTLRLSIALSFSFISVVVAQSMETRAVAFQVYSASSSQGSSCFSKNNASLYCKGGGAGGGRGFNVAVFYPGTDILKDAVNFDTWGLGNAAATELLNFLDTVPQGSLVLLSVGDEAGLLDWQHGYVYYPYAENILRAMEAFGSKQIRSYRYWDAWCLASYKGTGVALKEAFSHSPTGDSRTSTDFEVTVQVKAEERIVGVAYGPFRDGQSPDLGIFPTLAQMQADIPLLKRMGNTIRTYSVTNGFDQIIGLAKQAGLRVIPTAWLGRDEAANQAEIAKLIAVTKQYDNIPFVIVGSEAIYRKDQSVEAVIAAIRQVKRSVSVPVTTSEPWHILRENNVALSAEIGIICTNIFPYWADYYVGDEVNDAIDRYEAIQQYYSGRKVVITETGSPSAGETHGVLVPSVANQRRFWQEFLLRAAEKNIDFLAFEAFDEAWKRSPGKEAEGHWGLYTSSRQSKHDVISVNLTATTVSAASYLLGAAVARESIVSVFGNSFGSSPTVKVTSASQESAAYLFYTSPTQINYQIPVGIGTGIATVMVTASDGTISMDLTKIAEVAPGIFTATTDGKGIAAAKVQRIRADGATSYEEMVRYDQGPPVAIPIDLGPETEQVFLNLFGTGIRFRSSLSAVTAQIGGVNAEVSYAGDQQQYRGLDQINVRIPRSLQGHGEVDVVVMVDNQRANVVKINIR